MSKSLSKIFPPFLLLIIFLVPLTTNAAIENPLEVDTFQELVDSIITIIFNLALWIAPIMFIISGFYWITAAGDPKKIQTAKDIILYTIIGLIIVISARGLVALFKEVFRVGAR